MGGTALFWLQQQYTDRVAVVPGREVWGINSCCFGMRLDKCFSMHTESTMSGKFPDGDYSRADLGNMLTEEDHITKMVREGRFAKMHQEYLKTGVELVTPDGADGSLEYPLAKVVETFQSYYFTNTPAYMIPLAMLCGVKTITLHGVDFDYGDPRGAYEAGKPCVEYWIGRAQAAKIDVQLHAMTNLMSVRTLQQKGLYGYGYEQPEFALENGRICVKGFGKNPSPAGSGDESPQAIPLGGSGNHRDGADRNVLAPESVHLDGETSASVDNQLRLPGIEERPELFMSHQSLDGGERAGRSPNAGPSAHAGQQNGPHEATDEDRLQRQAACKA